MISIDLIKLADFTNPKDIATEIINQNRDITLPIPIEEIANITGIKDIQYKPLSSIEGALVANDTKSEGIIIINQNNISTRKRFTLAHELGHFLIPSHGFQMYCNSNDLKINHSNIIELEANAFSAEITMPERIFKAQQQFKSEPSIENIKKLSDLFGVSFSACAKRYVELSDYQIYMIFCHSKKTNYWVKSSEVELWLNCINKGSSLHHDSVTNKQCLSNMGDIVEDSVDAEVWFNENKNYELPSEVIEQVYIQKDGFSATLLWIEEELIEKE